jgi:probable addiction module antidote protein
MLKMKTENKHDDWLFEQLKDAEFAADFLNAASEDDDPATYLSALRKLVDARGGMANIAEQTKLSRETLYRTLSRKGNPTIKTLSSILKATGLKIAVSVH